MKEALGLIEVTGLGIALVLADAIAKHAPVRIREIEFTNGYGEVAIKFTGDTASVEQAFSLGCQMAKGQDALFASSFIPSPVDSVAPLVDTEPVVNPILEGYESLHRKS